MNDKAENLPCEVPLTERLRSVPKNERLIWTEADGLKATHYQPVGRYCHEAADKIDSLLAERDALRAALVREQQARQQEWEWLHPELGKAKAALKRYGRHTQDCAKRYRGSIRPDHEGVKCSCGYDEALESNK